MNKRKVTQLFTEFTVDLSSLIIANLAAYLLCFVFKRVPSYSVSQAWTYVLALMLSFCVVFFGFSVSLDLSKRNRTREFFAVLRNCLLTYMTLSVVLVLTRNEFVNGRFMLVSSLALFVCLSCINRYVSKRLLIHRFAKSDYVSLVGVITVEDRAEEFISSLQEDWTRNIRGVAVLDSQDSSASGGVKVKTERTILGVPVVAGISDVADWVRSEPLDEVYINIPMSLESGMAKLAEEIESMGIIVHINLPSLENLVDNSEFDNVECSMLAGKPVATLCASRPLSLTASFFKRLADIAGGLLGSIVSLPVILIVAVPLLIESPGPLIFKQPRVGKNGRVFNIYKLRSMYVDAEERKKELMAANQMNGFMFKMDNDPRITKVGRFIRKTSIDELPQFWNVLKGDMSLVGTRPPTLDEYSQYKSHHKRRLSMRPGITGMWQVSGRSSIRDFEDVVRLDCEYIDNWSPWLDLKIVLKTVAVVLRGTGAE